MHAGGGFCGSQQLKQRDQRSCALGGSPHSLKGVVKALNVSSVLPAYELLDLGHANVTPREAQGGPGTAPSGSFRLGRWSRVTLGSAGASGTSSVASHGHRHAHFAPFAHSKKKRV